jgi:hypothetical protein
MARFRSNSAIFLRTGTLKSTRNLVMLGEMVPGQQMPGTKNTLKSINK